MRKGCILTEDAQAERVVVPELTDNEAYAIQMEHCGGNDYLVRQLRAAYNLAASRIQQGTVLVPGLTGSDIENEWRRLHLGVDGDPDEDAFSAFEEGTKQGYDLAASRAHSVPSSRVLKDGEVAVPLEEWEAAGNLLFSARTAWVECETSGECDMSAVTKAAKAWDALRAQGKEGAE